MTRLSPLRCPQCNSPVPLAAGVGTATTPCSHCGAVVAIPADYQAAIAATHSAAEARSAAEPLWQKLSAPVGAGTQLLGLGLVLVLPVVATLVASLLPYPPWPRGEIYARVTLPAIAPGALLYLWAAAVAATTMRFRDALAAHPPRGNLSAPTCRICGAPLVVPADAIAVTCGYCGSDSLLEQVPVRALQGKLREAVRTLDAATRKLRLRRVVLAFGALGLALVIGGTSYLLSAALGV